MTHSPDPEVGSLAEETAKLLGAVAGWAREQDFAAAFGDHPPAADPADVPADSPVDASAGHGHERDLGQAPSCRWCPVCRVAHAVTQVPPDVTVHLASAFASLARAAEAWVHTAAPQPNPEDSESAGVEHIDLADWDDADQQD